MKNVQGDSLARGPKLLSVKNYVNQLTDDDTRDDTSAQQLFFIM